MTLDEFKNNLEIGDMQKSLQNYIKLKQEKYSIKFVYEDDKGKNNDDKDITLQPQQPGIFKRNLSLKEQEEKNELEKIFKCENGDQNRNLLPVTMSYRIRPRKLEIKEELLSLLQSESEDKSGDKSDFEIENEFWVIKKEEVEEVKQIEKEIERVDYPMEIRSRMSTGFPY